MKIREICKKIERGGGRFADACSKWNHNRVPGDHSRGFSARRREGTKGSAEMGNGEKWLRFTRTKVKRSWSTHQKKKGKQAESRVESQKHAQELRFIHERGKELFVNVGRRVNRR